MRYALGARNLEDIRYDGGNSMNIQIDTVDTYKIFVIFRFLRTLRCALRNLAGRKLIVFIFEPVARL